MEMEIKNKSKIGYKSEVIDGVTHIYITDEIIIDNNDFEQRVKSIALLKDMTFGEIAKQFGVTQGTFLVRCRNGKLTFEEQYKIAEILGCKLQIKFTFDDGAVYTGRNLKELIKDACAHIGITQKELAGKLGKSRQTFSSKITNGKLTDLEVTEIADKLGCTYQNYFELDDGTIV